jgi:hypothetical protein
MSEPETPVAVFIASRNARAARRRTLWVMSMADAMLVCQDPRTAGESYGLHWTAEGIDDPEVMCFVADDGRHAQVLKDHNVTVLRAA